MVQKIETVPSVSNKLSSLATPKSRKKKTRNIDVKDIKNLGKKDNSASSPQKTQASRTNPSNATSLPPGSTTVLNIYTDGSLARGEMTIEIYVDKDHPLNRSQIVEGRPISTRTEILAVINALKNLISWKDYKYESVVIHTDSLSVVSFATGAIKTKRLSEELLILQSLLKQCAPRNMSLQVKHVRGHSGIEDNEMADKLAAKAHTPHERKNSSTAEMKRARLQATKPVKVVKKKGAPVKQIPKKKSNQTLKSTRKTERKAAKKQAKVTQVTKVLNVSGRKMKKAVASVPKPAKNAKPAETAVEEKKQLSEIVVPVHIEELLLEKAYLAKLKEDLILEFGKVLPQKPRHQKPKKPKPC